MQRRAVWFAGLVMLVSTPALGQADYTRTRHPLVLVHGFLGFDRLVGSVEYFRGIPAELMAGGATVYVANVSSSNSSELRGEQLIAELEVLQALYGHERFNLVGHSQGGLTARYVASVRPDLVASVTTVGTPHQGSPVADGISAAAPEGSPLRGLVAGFVNGLSTILERLSGDDDPQDALAALHSLSTAGARAFNTTHPHGGPSSFCGAGPAEVDGIRYYSMGGTAVLTNLFDPSDVVLGAGALFFGFERSDGLVGECSSRWGSVVRSSYGWNHLDQVNLLFGLRGLFSPSPASVMRTHANRLKGVGR